MSDKKENIELKKGEIKDVNIVDEMESSYINYAMSVIVSRALPDVRDGLKPVQRRILYAMTKLGYYPNKAHKKSARTVGEVMGKYHPHGDVSIYDAMVRLAQDFNVRYPLVDGQGNFGSIDGDSPAAMRYTEAKMHKHALEIVEDLDKSTVNYVENYDGSEEEPVILPSRIPTMLLNGADGIAVGMATKIPPHNLTELIDGINYIIDEGNSIEEEKDTKIDYKEDIKNTDDLENLPKNRFPEFSTDVELEKIMEFIPAPDFPTGGEIYNQEEIKVAYATGKGKVVMRGVAEIEEASHGKYKIIISEIPYQVNKARLVSKIAQLVKDKKVEGISDLRDESNRLGIRVVVDIKRDGRPKTILNKLFKYTEMQKNFNANMLALVNGEPKVLNLLRILELFVQHRQEIVIRRSEYELAKAREREHILEGYMIALDNIDEIIDLIRNSADSNVAKEKLIERFELSEIQAQAILDMQLRRLAALEREKIETEYKEIKETISNLLKILTTPERVLSIISEELEEIKDKYGDERRSKVHKGKVGEFDETDLIAKEEVIVTVSKQGYIKRIKSGAYSKQKRGGVGKKFMTTKDEDTVEHVFTTSTHDDILFFTNKGRVFSEKVYKIPEYGRTAKGQPLINIVNVEQDELVTSILTRNPEGSVLDEDTIQEGETESENQGRDYKYLCFATKKGIVKKTEISEFENIRSNGLIAINLNDDDELAWVKPTTGDDEILLITKDARSIRFDEGDVRATGRNTMGVIGIKFKSDNDEVISADVIRKNEDLVLTVSKNGYGKVTKIEQYPNQNRGGQGVYAARVTKKTGPIVASRILDHPELELLLMSENGQAVRIETNNLPERNRQTSGVTLMRLRKGDAVSAIAVI
jgi:DNA gyrase subunit A